MKKRIVNLMITGIAIAVVMTSCRGSNKKEMKQPEPTPPPETEKVVNTIITVPEEMMVVIHKVADFSKWKASYESHDSARLKNGLHNFIVGRGLYDTSMVLVILKTDDTKKARSFAAGPDLKKLMQAAGVQGTPSFRYFIATWQDTSKMGYPLSLTTFDVKDWDKWRSNFDEGIQERDTNGVMPRILGREYDTNKKVVLVTALSDSARAFHYFKSDLLKKRREAAGVLGEPKRFIFRVIQQYQL